MNRKRRVAVIFGGQSSEHEVSRVSAVSVIKNMDCDKFDVVMIGITREGKWLVYDGPVEKIPTGEWEGIALKKAGLSPRPEDRRTPDQGNAFLQGAGVRAFLTAIGAESEEKPIDVIFPVLHGKNGEDGTIQGMFELAGIPYVGCGVLASSIGMDKVYAKIVFEKAGIPQGDYRAFLRKEVLTRTDWVIDQIERQFTYPCFVKPSNAGSSVGITKAHNREELEQALYLAAKYDRRILIEEFINGREVECAVLGNDEPVASTIGEVIPAHEFYDYDAKYNDDSQIIIPADFPEETVQQVREYAVKAFKALDCSGLSRVDFFVHKETGKVYINEINTLPGFTGISMYPKLWEASGIPYRELIERLIELAVERFEEKQDELRSI